MTFVFCSYLEFSSYTTPLNVTNFTHFLSLTLGTKLLKEASLTCPRASDNPAVFFKSWNFQCQPYFSILSMGKKYLLLARTVVSPEGKSVDDAMSG